LGGALKIYDSSLRITNCLFNQNIAHSGGAIFFTWSSLNSWNLDIEDSHFTSNRATEKGGAIYYDYKRPNFITNISYLNNTASYGPNIASYGVKITFSTSTSTDMKISNLGSGITYEQQMKLVVRDYDDQVMVLNNENQIIITSDNNTLAQVGGFNSGKFTFLTQSFII